MSSPEPPHPSDSSVQSAAEVTVLAVLEKQLGVGFSGQPTIVPKVKLDGYADGIVPTCVEAWARQGVAKAGQRRKVMADFCKLLLVERLLGKQCRKIFVVCDSQAVAFLGNSWLGRFATEFGIEVKVIELQVEVREGIIAAQSRQYR